MCPWAGDRRATGLLKAQYLLVLSWPTLRTWRSCVQRELVSFRVGTAVVLPSLLLPPYCCTMRFHGLFAVTSPPVQTIIHLREVTVLTAKLIRALFQKLGRPSSFPRWP